jgi:hypothetical protein
MDGETADRPMWNRPSWSHDGNDGSSDSATFTFTDPLRVR